MVMMVCFLSPQLTAFADGDKPSKTWDLSSKGKYSFSGSSQAATLYTNYLFTGKTSVTIKINNNKNKDVTVKYRRKDLIFDNTIYTVTIKPNESEEFTINNLDKSNKYYISFSGSCDVDGYIK